MPMHKTKNIIVILVTLLSGGCSALQGAQLIAPEIFGLVPFAPNVYVELRIQLIDATHWANRSAGVS